MTYLKQSKADKNGFFQVDNAKHATHFRGEDEVLRPIAELAMQLELESEQQQNEALTGELEESLNEVAQLEEEASVNDANKLITKVKSKRQQEEEGPLELPALNFGEEEKQKEKGTGIDDNVLGLPSMDFSRVSHQENQEEVKLHKVGAAGEEDALDVPKW